MEDEVTEPRGLHHVSEIQVAAEVHLCALGRRACWIETSSSGMLSGLEQGFEA